MKRSATLYKAKRRKKHALTGTSKEHFGQDADGGYVAFLPSEDLSDEDGSNSVSEIFHCPTVLRSVVYEL